jgi:hypothetical protein
MNRAMFYTTDRVARRVAKQVNATDYAGLDFNAIAIIVMAQCRGMGPGAWRIYDDAIGNAHSWTQPNGCIVRQVRNSPLGLALSDAVRSKA